MILRLRRKAKKLTGTYRWRVCTELGGSHATGERSPKMYKLTK